MKTLEISRQMTNRLHVVHKKNRGNRKAERMKSIGLELARELKGTEREIKKVEVLPIEMIWTDIYAWVDSFCEEEVNLLNY